MKKDGLFVMMKRVNIKFVNIIFLAFGRTIKGGWNYFFRNGYLSVAAVSVMLLCLFTISSLFLIVLTADSVLKGMQGNVNVSVYFKSSVPEESILKAKKELENYSEIKSAEYVTKEQALEIFNCKNGKVILVDSHYPSFF